MDSITKENETLFESKNENDNEQNILNKSMMKKSQLQQFKNKQLEEINTVMELFIYLVFRIFLKTH